MNAIEINRPPRAFHLSLETPDLAASARHYGLLFGAAPAVVKEDYVRFELSDPPVVMTLVPGRRGALSHLGVRIEDPRAYGAERERLERAGLVAREETESTCCYAVQDKVWSHDPDGRPFEVYHKRAEAPDAGSAAQQPETVNAPGPHAVPDGPAAACCTPPAPATREAASPSSCCTPSPARERYR